MRKTSNAILFLLGLLLTLYPTSLFLYIGLGMMGLVAFVNLLHKDPITRTKWIFITIFILMASAITIYVWRDFGIQPSDTFVEKIKFRLWSLFVGGSLSAIATIAMFTITIYVSGIYVLGLKEVEGLTGWHAFKSIASLIFNTQYDWIVINNGKITKTRPKGVMKKLGGPGKVIINTGNAVIFERVGTITQIRGAGVVKTGNVENIRAVIDLQKQYAIETFDTITADKITVSVELGIGYRVLPASEEPSTSGEIITDSKDKYPVYEGTLLNAAFNHTAGGWKGFAVGSVSGAIRDQIMAQKVEDLFEVSSGATTPETKIQGRAISAIEDAVKETVNGFAKDNGVEITVVDIRSIKLPQSMEDALAKIKRLEADTDAIRSLEVKRNATRIGMLKAVTKLLKIEPPFTPEQINSITNLMEAMNNTKPEQIMDHEKFDVLRKLAESDGTKIITAGGGSTVESPISIES